VQATTRLDPERARRIEWGQTQKSGRATGKSALPSRADIVNRTSLVRSVPRAEVTSLIRSPRQRDSTEPG
jgi:hypothetical protein